MGVVRKQAAPAADLGAASQALYDAGCLQHIKGLPEAMTAGHLTLHAVTARWCLTVGCAPRQAGARGGPRSSIRDGEGVVRCSVHAGHRQPAGDRDRLGAQISGHQGWEGPYAANRVPGAQGYQQGFSGELYERSGAPDWQGLRRVS